MSAPRCSVEVIPRASVWMLAIAGGLGMTAAIAYGFVAGDGWNEVSGLWAFPWFRVSIIDIYVGLAVIGVWIWSRESWPIALVWIMLLVFLGNLATCAYLVRVLIAQRRV